MKSIIVQKNRIKKEPFIILRRQKSIKRQRICKTEDCGTILSMYNKGKYCAICRIKEIRRLCRMIKSSNGKTITYRERKIKKGWIPLSSPAKEKHALYPLIDAFLEGGGEKKNYKVVEAAGLYILMIRRGE